MKFLVDQSALCQRGRGYWKLNSSLLNKDDISCRYVVDFYQLKDREIYTRNRSTWWNTVVKPKTQFFFKNESRIFNCRINSAKSELYAKMYDLAAERRNGADNRNQLQEVKSELMRMELDRLKFYGSRFPQTSMLEGEKMSVFHVSNQMHKGCDGSQFQLRDGDNLITDSKRLKKKIEDFFTGTFQAEDSASLESSAEALRDVSNSLDLQQQQELVRPIDEAELKAVVAGAAKKKSPGPDGISYEFYSVYFEMHFINENRTTPKVEERFPALNWNQLWENLGQSFLSSECRSQMFLLYNDLVISKEKLVKYNIGRLQDDLCEWCGVPESNEHKIKHCVKTEEIWQWLRRTLTDRLGICGDPEDVLTRQINGRNQKEKAGLWLTMFVMSYIVKKYPKTSLYCVQKGIRDSRWNNRTYFNHCFGSELNVC
ncbi:hypothetical protein pipiens_001843 [Culex pipiens pipiens]|uniref:Reverse transcriptase zinc-binding domain-containing protein n=1 Tax=Culex pipiens pipiens TaxID=38569 RepID=A0ABD1DT06_CULPP